MVTTKVGNLIANELKTKNYPGIMVGLTRKCVTRKFLEVEVEQSPLDELCMVLKMYDGVNEEPIFEKRLSAEEITEMYKEDDE